MNDDLISWANLELKKAFESVRRDELGERALKRAYVAAHRRAARYAHMNAIREERSRVARATARYMGRKDAL